MRSWIAAGICLLSLAATNAHAGPVQIDLGTAATFAVLSSTAVTNTSATTINGNLGVWPGMAVTGFPPGIVVNGAIHANDSTAAQAHTDVVAAYAAAVATPSGTVLTGIDLGGLTLTPGTYTFAHSAQLSGTLTLDAGSASHATFLFQIGSALTTASASSVILVNAGGNDSVVFQVGSSATLGTGTMFTGSILALSSITLNTGAVLRAGGAFARDGAVTLDGNTVSITASAGPVSMDVPEPASAVMLGFGVLLMTASRIRWCLVPGCGGTADHHPPGDAPWARFSTDMPGQQRRFVARSSYGKRA